MYPFFTKNNLSSEDAKKCPNVLFGMFFAVHLILGGKLGICGRDDLFLALHLILGGKLGICGRDDLQKNCPPFAQ